MNPNTEPNKTDFGEPWHEQEPPHPISVRAGVYWLNPRQFNRAVSCVNACAGMADPAAQIQAMRSTISACMAAMPVGNIQTHTPENLAARIGDLASALAAETAENEAMREAIKEAYAAISGLRVAAPHPQPKEHPSLYCASREADVALTKLQPFIKP